MKFFATCLAPVSLSLVLAAGCSSNDSSAPGGANDGGSDAAIAMVGDGSTGADSAVLSDAAPPTSSAACAFATSGDRTDPTTNALSCPGYLKQVKGMGDYTINVAAGFASTMMENVNLGFTLSSPTPPAAGDKWTLGQDGRTGNLSLTVTKGQAGTIWSTSDTDSAMVKGATSVTFVSVTKMNGTQQPQDVYYLFEVTLETSLVGRTAGTTSTKVTGHFKVASLPFGA